MVETFRDILSFDDGVLSVDLDMLLRVDTNMAASYDTHKRLGFSYRPYAASVAERVGLPAYLQYTVQQPEELCALKLVATTPDIGVTTSFLKGLLQPVVEFAPYPGSSQSSDHWLGRLSVEVTGRYVRATRMALEDYLEGVREHAREAA